MKREKWNFFFPVKMIFFIQKVIFSSKPTLERVIEMVMKEADEEKNAVGYRAMTEYLNRQYDVLIPRVMVN